MDNWDVEFAGWNADPDYVPLQGTGIHHPSGDVKKICFETDAPYKVTKYPGTSNEAEVWYIDQWEEGVTEHGSSGSPLFDPHHRIIGQLYGGTAACNGNVNNGEPDWYGRFDVTYTFLETLNPNPLDPQNILDSGNWVWDGTAAFSFPIGTDIELTSIEGLTYYTCLIGNENAVTITLTNLALENIAVADIQLIYGVKDSVSGVHLETAYIDVADFTSEDILYSPSNNGPTTVQVNIPTAAMDDLFTNYANGTLYQFFAEVEINGVVETNNANNSQQVSFIRNSDNATLEIALTTDDYPEETSWIIRDETDMPIAVSETYSSSQTEYTEEVCLFSPSCYDFTIYDSQNDGLQFALVSGDLVLTLDNIEIYNLEDQTSDNNFGSSETINFYVGNGDLNADCDVNVLDIVTLVDHILVGPCPVEGDINNDAICNILDIVALVNIIFNQTDRDETLAEADIF